MRDMFSDMVRIAIARAGDFYPWLLRPLIKQSSQVLKGPWGISEPRIKDEMCTAFKSRERLACAIDGNDFMTFVNTGATF